MCDVARRLATLLDAASDALSMGANPMGATQTTHPAVKNVYLDGRLTGYIGRRPQTWWAHRSYGDQRGPNRDSRGFRSEQAAVDWIIKEATR
jgi:hypothetical protein